MSEALPPSPPKKRKKVSPKPKMVEAEPKVLRSWSSAFLPDIARKVLEPIITQLLIEGVESKTELRTKFCNQGPNDLYISETDFDEVLMVLGYLSLFDESPKYRIFSPPPLDPPLLSDDHLHNSPDDDDDSLGGEDELVQTDNLVFKKRRSRSQPRPQGHGASSAGGTGVPADSGVGSDAGQAERRGTGGRPMNIGALLPDPALARNQYGLPVILGNR